MTGRAARCVSTARVLPVEADNRLAITCGLHVIPSSVWKPTPHAANRYGELSALMRQRIWAVPPPSDPLALGERIWAL